jgi:hypothetical protein
MKRWEFCMDLSDYHFGRLLIVTLVTCTALVGCGAGNGEGLDDNGRPVGEGGADTPPLAPTFSSIQANIFTPDCTVCHAGANAPLGLRLDEVNSFGMLVGIPSVQVPGLLHVDPGAPDLSYLIHKLEGTAAIGGQMPLNAPALPQSTIDFVRQWITDGAMPDMPTTPPINPVRVVSLSPPPDSTLDSLPPSVIAIFDREPDASTVNDLTFIVERSGGDGSFTEGNEVPITAASVSVPLNNPTSAVFDLTGVAPVEDTYRVRLLGSGPSIIQDIDANGLDGEFSGVFPSGNGAQGGDFIAMFEIAGIQPTLESIQNNVFTPICSACHSGPTSGMESDLPSGMDLSDVTASFNSLVNVASLEVPALFRVDPGDPDNSYLIHKLEGTQAVGAQMPDGGPFLPQDTIDVIRDWIQQGASW